MADGRAQAVAELKNLARDIILAQGNTFIKELLRENGIKIGSTKREFQQNLNAAIESGYLTRDEFISWMKEIEGWGDQHIYLYEFPANTARGYKLHDPDRVKELATAGGLEGMFGLETSMMFSAERVLTGIYSTEQAFGIVWHQGAQTWVRDKSRDYTEEIQGDTYEFRAHRERGKRSVMRFEWPTNRDYAAIFLQIPAEQEDHDLAKRQVWEVLGHFTGSTDALDSIDLNTAVEALDQGNPGPGALAVAAEETRYAADGANVTFKSLIPDQDYKTVPAVGQVRNAVNPSNFIGSEGRFNIQPSKAMDLSREIKLQIYSRSQRIRIWVQCKKSDVWNIVDYIAARA